uniref:Secreted protein n=1 Tax=Anser brachyrhynchus TaxID=132585 RepID=A0A8B9BR16_9AVES
MLLRFLICLKHTALLSLNLCTSPCKDPPAWVRLMKPHFFMRPPPVDTLSGPSSSLIIVVSCCPYFQFTLA